MRAWGGVENVAFNDIVAEQDGDAISLSGHALITLPPRLMDVVERGIPLYFIVESEVVHRRWYFFDEMLGGGSRTWRLAFHPLTRKYRLSQGVLHLGFDSVEEALAVIGNLRQWVIVPSAKKNLRYVVSLRVRVDFSKLPSPFQVAAWGNADWQLDSGWVRIFIVQPGVDR